MTTTCRIVVPSVRVLSYLQHISRIGPGHAHLTAKREYQLIRYFIRSLVSITIARLSVSFVLGRQSEIETTLGYTAYMCIAQSTFVGVWTREQPSKMPPMIANSGAGGGELGRGGAT